MVRVSFTTDLTAAIVPVALLFVVTSTATTGCQAPAQKGPPATAATAITVRAPTTNAAAGPLSSPLLPLPPVIPAVTTMDPSKRYKVTAASASFYRYGPSQPGGPDLGIKQGTRVTLTKRSFGYSQIRLADGTAGFIGTEDIKPLTTDEIAAETIPPSLLPAVPGSGGMNVVANRGKPGTASGGNNGRRRARPGPNLPISPGDEPPLPAAPEPSLPPGEVPTFRY